MKIANSKLFGKVNVPPSKSYGHRAILAAALASGTSVLSNLGDSEDIQTTLDLANNIGAEIEVDEEGNHLITGVSGNVNLQVKGLNANESASSLRFIIPIVLTTENNVTFRAKGKLRKRPLEPYFNIFDQCQISYNQKEFPFTVEGVLKPGEFNLEGDISSQFLTGLLFALPLLDGKSIIKLDTKLESKQYIDLTLDVLKMAGIKVTNNKYREFIINGNQNFKAFNYTVEGDFSQAAFFIVAGIMGGNRIELNNLNLKSLQGDRKIIDIVTEMGAKLKVEDDTLVVLPSSTRAIPIDMSDIPDLGPILAVLGTYSYGKMRLYNAKRLRLKESDRISCIIKEFKKFGITIDELEDEMIIHHYKYPHYNGDVTSHKDHRIAMALGILMSYATGTITMKYANSVSKSYPDFWEVYRTLNGKVEDE